MRCPTGDELYLALSDVAAAERVRRPALFARVDRLLAVPDRAPQSIQPFAGAGRVRECPRCGNPFPVYNHSDRFCSAACRKEHRAFLRNREVRVCPY